MRINYAFDDKSRSIRLEPAPKETLEIQLLVEMALMCAKGVSAKIFREGDTDIFILEVGGNGSQA